MRKVITSANYVLQKEHMETVRGSSVTVPNEAMTVREIFERFTTGTVRLDQRQVGYDSMPDFDSPDLEKVRNLDMVDLDQFKGDLAQSMLSNEQKLKEANDAALKAKADADAEVAALRDLLRQKRSGGEPPEDLAKKANVNPEAN